MPTLILMPALSPEMEEAKIAKWHVKEGDEIRSGMVIAELETDKATMEVEAVDEGKVGRILVPEGTGNVKVNTPIMVLDAGEGSLEKETPTGTRPPASEMSGPKSEPDWTLPPSPAHAASGSIQPDGRIFVSYRRSEDLHAAGRIHDRLLAEYGTHYVFMDVNSIPFGVNFVHVLREEVANCSILLAVIGKTWLTVSGTDGRRRLDDENDFVRVEISEALKRDIPVVPVLFDGTPMPQMGELPENLKDLSLRNALEVRHTTFHNDMDRLIADMNQKMRK